MTEQPTGWRKSSRSQQKTACVEVANLGSGAAVRDTKDRGAGYFTAGATEWSSFIGAIKSGRFDR